MSPRILSRTRSSIDGEDLSSPQKKKRKTDGPEQSSSDTRISPQLVRQKTVLNRTVLDPPTRLTAPSPLASSSHLNVPTLSTSSPASPALAVHPVPSTSASTGHQSEPFIRSHVYTEGEIVYSFLVRCPKSNTVYSIIGHRTSRTKLKADFDRRHPRCLRPTGAKQRQTSALCFARRDTNAGHHRAVPEHPIS